MESTYYFLNRPKLPRLQEVILRWGQQIRILNVLFVSVGLARTQMSIRRITRVASCQTCKLAHVSGIRGMTAVWIMTVFEQVG